MVIMSVAGKILRLNRYMFSTVWNNAWLIDIKDTYCHKSYTGEKATMHQVTTMVATSKNVLYVGHNHLLTTGANDPTL